MSEMGRSVDFFGYLGDFTQRSLSRRISENRLIQIAPGIDVSHFTPGSNSKLRNSLGLEKQKVIVSVGRLVHRKGQDRLIEALPKIRQSIPDCQLLMIGEGPYRKRLEKFAVQHGVEGAVRFIGRVSYDLLPEYLRIGDLFAMPSRSRLFGLEVEGLGIVYLEASSVGLPVIAGDSGGAPDAVLHGETGYVVSGNNVDEIASRCIEILTNDPLRESMSQSGRKFAMDQWRWENWSKRFNDLFILSKSK